MPDLTRDRGVLVATNVGVLEAVFGVFTATAFAGVLAADLGDFSVFWGVLAAGLGDFSVFWGVLAASLGDFSAF